MSVLSTLKTHVYLEVEFPHTTYLDGTLASTGIHANFLAMLLVG